MADFLCPAVNFIGRGTLAEVGPRAAMFGKKALIVTDKFLASQTGGAVDQVKAHLDKAGVVHVLYGGVDPNPRVANVEEGLTIYRKEKCDLLVTVGGGSAHDCGKGIGIAATHDGDLYDDYAGIEKLTNELPPIIAVNTTAGTGSEVTRHCVLTNMARKIKFVIVSWRNLPKVSINDPELMIGKPAALTASTGMDALTHAVECYVTLAANEATDAVAIRAIKLVGQHLRRAVAYGEDIVAREGMAYASLLAGMAFNNAGLGYVHAMAHQLGGMLDMPHGMANAILLPHVERWNLMVNPGKFADIAVALGENIDGLGMIEAAEKAITAIERLSSDVGIPKSLAALGVKESDLEPMAKQALLDGNAGCNPRKGNVNDIIALFKAAM
ncbi:MAG: iron-containing alcohol dehydrogenase [Solidesulfovibrio sp.]|uniref:iron-containing alcohol dehydrogenase n=1 Tax=Solidesulfovibrio sp. TaxID=2910990 RepID=UPI00315942C7